MSVSVERLGDNDLYQWNDIAKGFSLSHPFNSRGWGRVRETDGWRPLYLIVRGDDGEEIRIIEVKGNRIVVERVNKDQQA